MIINLIKSQKKWNLFASKRKTPADIERIKNNPEEYNYDENDILSLKNANDNLYYITTVIENIINECKRSEKIPKIKHPIKFPIKSDEAFHAYLIAKKNVNKYNKAIGEKFNKVNDHVNSSIENLRNFDQTISIVEAPREEASEEITSFFRKLTKRPTRRKTKTIGAPKFSEYNKYFALQAKELFEAEQKGSFHEEIVSEYKIYNNINDNQVETIINKNLSEIKKLEPNLSTHDALLKLKKSFQTRSDVQNINDIFTPEYMAYKISQENSEKFNRHMVRLYDVEMDTSNAIESLKSGLNIINDNIPANTQLKDINHKKIQNIKKQLEEVDFKANDEEIIEIRNNNSLIIDKIKIGRETLTTIRKEIDSKKGTALPNIKSLTQVIINYFIDKINKLIEQHENETIEQPKISEETKTSRKKAYVKLSLKSHKWKQYKTAQSTESNILKEISQEFFNNEKYVIDLFDSIVENLNLINIIMLSITKKVSNQRTSQIYQITYRNHSWLTKNIRALSTLKSILMPISGDNQRSLALLMNKLDNLLYDIRKYLPNKYKLDSF